MNSSLDVRDHREQIGLDVEAAAGDTSKIDLIWVPGEGSSTGNVTGGRKFARHHFCGAAPVIQSSQRGSKSLRRASFCPKVENYFQQKALIANQQTISKPAPNTNISFSDFPFLYHQRLLQGSFPLDSEILRWPRNQSAAHGQQLMCAR
jgi:hypothetical protein